MDRSDGGLQLVERELQLFEQESETWKAAHHAAVRCRELEAALALGAFIFQEISRLDEFWHSAVYTGATPYEDRFEQAIERLYRRWAKAYEAHERELVRLEREGFLVEGAEEFRRCGQAVTGVLTQDKDFFAADSLVELRDQAVDSHRRGETAELMERSD